MVLDHLVALTDDTGVIQHATYDVPNRATGYCTDDVARALLVALAAARSDPADSTAARLIRGYLAFLHDAQLRDGWFHNFLGFDRRWQDRRGSPDAFGRALWALGACRRYALRACWRAVADQLIAPMLVHVPTLTELRPRAYAALGIAHLIAAEGTDRDALGTLLARTVTPLATAFDRQAGPGWVWCEEALTYDNARFPEALARAGIALGDDALVARARDMLHFYATVVIEPAGFWPVGNVGWYPRGGPRARYGQQPLEAAALIDASVALRAADPGDSRYAGYAQRALAWYHGENSAGVPLVRDGGCCDGIDASGPNPNMGAESTLSYLQSVFGMRAFEPVFRL